MDPIRKPSCLANTNLSTQSLLSLSDLARLTLRDGNSLDNEAKELRKFLLAMWDSDVRRKISPMLDVIRDAHLDKLLDEILSSQLASGSGSTESPLHKRIAEGLRQLWTSRYGDDYGNLNRQRLMQMVQVGNLRELEFIGLNTITAELWQAKSVSMDAGKTIQRTTDRSHLEASKYVLGRRTGTNHMLTLSTQPMVVQHGSRTEGWFR